MKRILLVTPDLVDTIGHEFEYTASVAQAFRQRGYAVRILGGLHATSDVKALEGFEGCFPRMQQPSGARSVPWEVLRQAFVFAQHLQRTIDITELAADDVLVVPNILQTQFLGWALMLSRSERTLPKVVLLFRFSLRVGNRSRFTRLRQWLFPKAYRELWRLVERSRCRPVIVSDSDELCLEHAEYTRLPVQMVPIPVNAEAMLSAFREFGSRNTEASRFHVVYLGDVRKGKGFDLLPEMVSQLERKQQTNICLTVHCGRTPSRFADDEIGRAYHALCEFARTRASGSLTIRLVASCLDRTRYWKLLWEADVVLLPYRREYYLSQTSNVLAEAFIAGRPVIAPKATWLGNQVQSTGAGVVFESGNVQSLVAAILDAAEHRQCYFDNASAIQATWASFHTADRLAQTVESLVEVTSD